MQCFSCAGTVARATSRGAAAQKSKGGETLITLEGVGRTHDGQRQLFSDVTFTLRRGERLAVVGANGSGKTTLLRVIAGLRLCWALESCAPSSPVATKKNCRVSQRCKHGYPGVDEPDSGAVRRRGVTVGSVPHAFLPEPLHCSAATSAATPLRGTACLDQDAHAHMHAPCRNHTCPTCPG